MPRKRSTLALVKPVSPVPHPKDELREKLDRLALSLADALMSGNTPISERLSGLKVLTEYWKSDRRNSGERALKPVNAFDDYQRMIAGDDDAS